MPSSANIAMYRQRIIDATVSGVVDIATTDNAEDNFIPMAVVVNVNAVISVTQRPTISVGTNSDANADSIVANTLLDAGLSSSDPANVQNLPLRTPSALVGNNVILRLRVAIPAIATNYQISVAVFGITVPK